MGYIYTADVYCDDCGEHIKCRIAADVVDNNGPAFLADHVDRDGWADLSYQERIDDCVDQLDCVEQSYYDSGDYPKWGSDDDECDCPQHCGSGADCINAHVFDDGDKCGCLIGSNLTDAGMEYVREAVAAGGDVADLWRAEFDYVDFG